MAIEFWEREPDRQQISREEIAASSSVPELLEWYDDLLEFEERMRAQVEARILTQTDDDDWLCRVSDRLSFCGAGRVVIKRRLKALGAGAPDHDKALREMRIELEQERAGKSLRTLFVDAARDALDSETFAAIMNETRRRLTERAEAIAVKSGKEIARARRLIDDVDGLAT